MIRSNLFLVELITAKLVAVIILGSSTDRGTATRGFLYLGLVKPAIVSSSSSGTLSVLTAVIFSSSLSASGSRSVQTSGITIMRLGKAANHFVVVEKGANHGCYSSLGLNTCTPQLSKSEAIHQCHASNTCFNIICLLISYQYNVEQPN